jgi:hypothetical protein
MLGMLDVLSTGDDNVGRPRMKDEWDRKCRQGMKKGIESG